MLKVAGYIILALLGMVAWVTPAVAVHFYHLYHGELAKNDMLATHSELLEAAYEERDAAKAHARAATRRAQESRDDITRGDAGVGDWSVAAVPDVVAARVRSAALAAGASDDN